ncbi:RNA polymerase sigma-70 factor (ECF subfamily) [Archangium gephyra]|uniref:RNA polymerase sigma-70 factor (ECF subfamily) n=1 Tax=Archangium gephyra TaxID=48 RepID=A0ABX9K1Y7_9BACT|nr:RNA polymerase sigma-70 factor (ECF subfamily) [Archangium gephyra]
MTILLQLQSGGSGPRPGVFGSGRVLSPPSPNDALSRADSQQISLLFNQHGARVYRRALRLLGNPADAEEATQEIFIRVFRAAGSFRQQSQMTTWLYQITTNYCLNHIRDRSRRTALHEEHVAPLADDGSRTEAVSPDDLVLLRRLLADADERQAAAAVYVFLDGMSHEEAASVLGVSKRTVGNLLERFQEWVNARTAGGTEETPPPPPPPERKSSGFLGFGRRRS